MRSIVVLLGLLVLVGSSQAEAGNPVALIWKGAKSKAEAEAQRSAWDGINNLLAKTGFVLAEGHPRLIESKTLPGLKPGFWVWLLGVCPSDEAGSLLEQIKVLSPETYSREVKVSAKMLACPSKEGPALEARNERLKLPDGATLRVITHEESHTPEEDEGGDSYTRTQYYFVLVGKGGDVLGWDNVVGEEDVTGDPRNGPMAFRCEVTGIKASGGSTLVLTRQCRAGVAECGSVVGADEVTPVTVKGTSVSAGTTKRENEEREDCSE
ncbi:hypothetical protein [Hyalangium rubrum]|uniref:Lipoprotein n=1 Tax=Hyalangium rubrum TaxID=3103134 RepID=A0ABU5H8A2_9BACT|nr:hypothetical protein [Hyalangium sp. s54d21]MDY7229372.1 hypothetical protein [Hyalangium sp. s54d21]